MSYNKILDNDVKAIKKDMSNLVEATKSQYGRTFEAMKKRDIELANQVISGDKVIDQLQNKFTNMALWKIAKQQMVAGDLRLAVGSILISREIERIADYAKLICMFYINYQPGEIEIGYISKMFDLVNQMLNFISSLFENYENEHRKKVLELRKMLDTNLAELNESLVAEIESSNKLAPKKSMLFISAIRELRNLERAGDHLVNVEEILNFIRTGKFDEVFVDDNDFQ
ncbi:phosphate transport system regulator PhoU [Spiroplasma sabaudiense Ar-1343]|uniref:Phosphate transport system regulator PhoU n=1 Tax=Spiroplasma sabaudiense Ar-1343 TaxID=1276257 RepID=W6AJZ6_9MOLU|nr:phosphate signaling complex protein PhoU [Spiroplasma sabaudiense]AHI54049.1 phosphate transport system regulator PhoU [Spiroplasma sabaudiense Ar-1343]